MEQAAASSGGQSQTPPTSATAEEPLTRHILASFRSLILNPSTPASLISSILETLTRHLQLSRDPILLHHILKLLAELAHRNADHSAAVSQSVSTFLLSTESPRLAAESLDTLASISDKRTFDDSFFLSLCFNASVPSRLWLLKNAGRFGIRPYLLFTIFLGFTKDPYPYVRQAALDGLVSLSKSGVIEDHSLIKGCYDRAVELLGDAEACIRTAAVHTVSEWGHMLVASARGTDKMELSDAVFIQVCSMVRDMSVEVRVAAFDALRKTEMVSVGVLLQTLSKKVLDIMKEKKNSGQVSRGQALASVSAGALMHGLEDEYYEVRHAACCSMQKLTSLSSEFSSEAINLLIDMLNDDSMAVRLQVLETMHQMADRGQLSLKVAHMHMFLGSLTDNSSLIRDAVRKVLKSVKLQTLELFRLSVYGIIESLQRYHQDEVEIFSVLFRMGRRHGSFTESLVNRVFQELEPASDGEIGFDNARVAAFLVLAIACPLSHGKNNCKIPALIFSYAVTILGRISHALADEVDQDTLLAYLSHCGRGSMDSAANVMEIPTLAKCNRQSLTENNDRLLKSLNIILCKIEDIWSVVKLGLLDEVLRTLRACKRELAVFDSEPAGSSPCVAFVEQHLRIVKLLSQIYVYFLPAGNYHNYKVGNMYILMGKLDRRLRDIRCRFIGLSKQEKLRIMELLLLSYVFKLSQVEICCSEITMRKLSAVLTQIVHLQEEASIKPSSFVTEMKKIVCENPCSPSLFRKVLDRFSLGKYKLSGTLEYVSAELYIPGNNSENPLYLVRGLPVAIPMVIKLSSVSRERRLWLKMTVGEEESTQFLYLDTKLCSGSKSFDYSAPFYNTPKAFLFTLKISIGMESEYESADVSTRYGGPRHELTFLTPDKHIYFSSAKK